MQNTIHDWVEKSSKKREVVKELYLDNNFPEDDANSTAKLEAFNKHRYRPNSYLHKWWARRSGTTFRHILKQLVREKKNRDYFSPGGLEQVTLLDPMMGGGTTIHEAIRLGANVAGVDIDPIPILQVKASLSWSDGFKEKAVFKKYLHYLEENLRQYYMTSCPECNSSSEFQFVLYGLLKKCSCGESTFVDSYTIRENRSRPSLKICEICADLYCRQEKHCKNGLNRIFTKSSEHCEKCGNKFKEDLSINFSERYVPLIVVGNCRKHGQFYKKVSEDDKKIIESSIKLSKTLKFGDLHLFGVPHGPKSRDLSRKGVKYFFELFTPRQLIYLYYSKKFIDQCSEHDKIWLSLLVSTSLEFNSALCGYKGAQRIRPGAVRHVFSHHAYSFPYTSLENNPLFSKKTSGTLLQLFNDRVEKAVEWANQPTERKVNSDGKTEFIQLSEVDKGREALEIKNLHLGTRKFYLLQHDSSKLPFPIDFFDFVITDPPYFDSVQYSDLSNFFRVWLRYFLPKAADWGYDQTGSAVSSNAHKNGDYADTMGKIWSESARVLKSEGRLAFTFHHWNPKAWAELAISLKRAGFNLVNRYVVFSENPISVHIQGLKALKHDCILVFSKNPISAKKWGKPKEIHLHDSYSFCKDCGSILGWVLESDISEAKIYEIWNELLSK